MLADFFFHIHYCNGQKLKEPKKITHRLTRTLQHHELIFILNAHGSIVIGEKKYSIKKGMLFYIPSGVPQTIELDNQVSSNFMTVHFSYAHVVFNDGKWNIHDEMQMLSLRPAQELNDYYFIEELFQKLVASWETKLPGYEFITKTLLQELFIAISQNIKKKNQNYAHSLKVEKIIQYMHKNINHQVTLTELSDLVQLSSFYLSRTFKEVTGYSIIKYFNKIKIDKAKELLAEGNKKVKEVAQELGYADEFYFSRMFKRIEGMSPSEFYSKIIHDF